MTTTLGPILITGCSTGIGRSAAEFLLKAGHTVYATARKPETLEELAALGARTLALDVTDEASMAAAVNQVEAEHGRVGVLINNAGFGVYGPIEEVPMDEVRRMFETNVFGLARLSQLVLPAMRAAGRGRIINIGSMGGRIVFPIGGYYHATKYAVEALSDALRFEVAPFGVDVVLIEPGAIRTSFEETINASLVESYPAGSAYGDLVAKVSAVNADAYSNTRMSVGPEAVAETILKAVEARKPNPRYVVTPAAKVMIAARRLGGDRLWDAMLGQSFR